MYLVLASEYVREHEYHEVGGRRRLPSRFCAHQQPEEEREVAAQSGARVIQSHLKLLDTGTDYNARDSVHYFELLNLKFQQSVAVYYLMMVQFDVTYTLQQAERPTATPQSGWHPVTTVYTGSHFSTYTARPMYRM